MSEKPRLSYSDDNSDDIDVPRVERDIYRMAGRAAPQRIEPRESEPVTPQPTTPQPTTPQRSTEHQSATVNTPASSDDTTATDSAPAPAGEQPRSEAPIRGNRGAQGSATTKAAAQSSLSQDDSAADSAPTEVFAHTHLASAPTAGAGEPGRYATTGAPEQATAEQAAAEQAVPETAETQVIPRGNSEAPYTEPAPADDQAVLADNSGAAATPTDIAREAPRGTIDFGILLLRFSLAAVFLYHGLVTLFGVGGSGGVDGLESSLAGVQGAGSIAWAIPIVEVLAGVLLILGVLGPLGMTLGLVVASFLTIHSLGGQASAVALTALPAVTKYWGLTALASCALLFMGPGRLSFDRGRSWAHRPVVSGLLGVIVGCGVGIGAWFLLGGTIPQFI